VSYSLAWMVAVVAGVIGAGALYVLTRALSSGLLRWLLCLLPPIVLLVPAPVPGFGGYIAPAFVVAIFESVFVADGHPRAALVILAVAACGAALAILLVGRALSGREEMQEITEDNVDNSLNDKA